MDKLERCPFCGAEQRDADGPVLEWKAWRLGVSYHVLCQRCGASTRMFSLKVADLDTWSDDPECWHNSACNNAVWAWNRRFRGGRFDV